LQHLHHSMAEEPVAEASAGPRPNPHRRQSFYCGDAAGRPTDISGGASSDKCGRLHGSREWETLPSPGLGLAIAHMLMPCAGFGMTIAACRMANRPNRFRCTAQGFCRRRWPHVPRPRGHVRVGQRRGSACACTRLAAPRGSSSGCDCSLSCAALLHWGVPETSVCRRCHTRRLAVVSPRLLLWRSEGDIKKQVTVGESSGKNTAMATAFRQLADLLKGEGRGPGGGGLSICRQAGMHPTAPHCRSRG
jgi:hypothetical protein